MSHHFDRWINWLLLYPCTGAGEDCSTSLIMMMLSVLLTLAAVSPLAAFQPVRFTASNSNTQLEAMKLHEMGKAALATAVVSATLWTSPIQEHSPFVLPAEAKEMASGSGSRVNKDADSLLRLGLPITNKEVRQLEERGRRPSNETKF